jgi:hypothetical protein
MLAGNPIITFRSFKYSTPFILCRLRIAEKTTCTQGVEKYFKHRPYRNIKGYARNIFTIGGGKLKAGENIILNFVELHAGGKTSFLFLCQIISQALSRQS